MKSSDEVEQIMKGVANHRRVDILLLLSKDPNLSVEEISEVCKADHKTVSVHLKRMHQSGLINKKYMGRRVEHRLNRRGLNMLTFLRTLE